MDIEKLNVADLEIQWPIVGQGDAVNEIRAHFRSTDPPSFAVLGVSGIGKTTLLRTVESEARHAGLEVVAIHGVQSNPAIALAPLLPLLPPDAPVDADDGTLYRLLVSQLTRSKPTLISVDDAHLLDNASAAAVNAIAVSRSALLVVNARSDLAAPDPILALWKDDVSVRIDLLPLDHDDISTALTQLLGAVDGSVVDQASALSQGSPLFLHELVLDALESGVLVQRDERWQLTKPLAGSQRVYDVVDRRLSALSSGQIDALSALALREHLDVATFEDLAPVATLYDLERRGLTRSSLDGKRQQIALGHPLYAQVLRDRLSAKDRMRLLSAIADAVSRSGQRRMTDPLLVAMCRIEADQDVDPEELRRAADRAVALYDYDLGESLARAGFDRGHFGCGLTLYRALNGMRRHEEADLLHDELLAAATSADECALAHLAAALVLLQQRDDIEGSIRHRNAGLLEDPSPETRLQLTVHEMVTSFVMGEHAVARRILDVLPDLRELPPLVAASFASHAAGIELLSAQFDSALSYVDELRSLEASLGRVGWLDRERTDFAEVATLVCSFQPSRARRVGSANVESAEALSAEGSSIALLGEQYANWLSGYIGPAWASYERWTEAVLTSTDRLTDPAGHVFGALTAFDRGQAADFERCCQRYEAAPLLLLNVAPVHAVLYSRRNQLAGKPDAAHSILVEALPEAFRAGGLHFAAVVAHELVLLDDAPTAAEALRDITVATPSEWVAHWWLELADAVVANDKSALVALASRFGETGYLLDAAHTAGFAARLTPSPLERFILLTRARRWLDEGQAVSAIVEAVEPPVSPREGEILLAAGRGLANREIGELFVISPRTAANHLHRAYQKLGLAREDLSEAFAEFQP